MKVENLWIFIEPTTVTAPVVEFGDINLDNVTDCFVLLSQLQNLDRFSESAVATPSLASSPPIAPLPPLVSPSPRALSLPLAPTPPLAPSPPPRVPSPPPP